MNAYPLVLLSMLPLAAQAQDAAQMGLGQCAAQLMHDKDSLWAARQRVFAKSEPGVPQKPSWARKLLVDPISLEASYGRGSTIVPDGEQDWRVKHKDREGSISLLYSLPLNKLIPAPPPPPPPELDRAEIESKAAFYDLIHDARIAALEAAQSQARASMNFPDPQAAPAASLALARLEKLLVRIKHLTNDEHTLYNCRLPG
jgi:hypothetical protein